MRCVLLSAVLFLATACAPVAGDEPEPVADDEVWITIGLDALDTVRGALEVHGADDAVKMFDRGAESGILRIRQAHIPELTHIMHEDFHRCGGYVAHESYKQALQALDTSYAELAAQKVYTGYGIDNAEVVEALISELEEARIRGTISTLSSYTNRYYTTQSGVDAAIWLRDLWQGYAADRSDASVELYQHSGYPQPSVILTIQGDTYPDEVVVVGGHLDSTAGWSPGPSTSAPGADDDASGIATLSEVARVALEHGFQPRRTIKFIGYAAEEVGLRGSSDIAAAHLAQGVNVIGVLQLDMTNYNGSSEDIALISDRTNASQNQFLGNLIDTYLGLSWTYTQCGYACSDHASWHSRGYAASFPFEARMNQHNPYIHTASDTLAQSGGHAQHALKFARLATAYVAELAKGDIGGDPGNPDPDPPPEPTVEVFTGSVAQGAQEHYGPFVVQPGSAFRAEITGTGDADLYVKFGAAPTLSSYDCRPYRNGSNETCELAVPGDQTHAYVMIRGYQSATYTLTVTYHAEASEPTPPQEPTTETFSGSLSQGQQHHYGPFSSVGGSTLTAQITGTGDADLYVRFGAPPTTSAWDCRPYRNGSSETCTLTVPGNSADGYVMVRGYASATYDLSVTYTPN